MILREIKTKYQHYFVDEQGRVQGEWKSFFENGNIQRIAYYKNDKREGEYKCFYENGNIEEISYWKNGEDITKKVLAKRELLKEIEQL